MGRSSDPSTYVPTSDHSSDSPYHSSKPPKSESARRRKRGARGRSSVRIFAFGCLFGLVIVFLLLAPDSKFSNQSRDLFYVMQHSIVAIFDAFS